MASMIELRGAKVLVLEDEYFIAQELRQGLEAAGAHVLGPVADPHAAAALIGRERVDVAILDINLLGSINFAVADELRLRGIPFVFATGYEPAIIPGPFRDAPLWRKPFNVEAMVASLAEMSPRHA